MESFWVDTNIIIRFLTNDHDEHSPAARSIMQKVQNRHIQLYLNPIVVGECFRVLWKVYEHPKKDVSQRLVTLFSHSGFTSDDKELILEALHNSGKNSRLSFEDAYIAGKAKRHSEQKILMFNSRDFRKLQSEFYTPFEVWYWILHISIPIYKYLYESRR